MLASPNNVSELGECDACSDHALLSRNICSPFAHHASSCDSDVSCSPPHSPSGESDEQERNFDCNICMQICQEPVVTMCGHLFCWPCLYDRISLHSASKVCPACKADVQHKIVPLYGCGRIGSLAEKSRGIQIPCRPSVIAQSASCRSEPPHHAIQHIAPQDGGFLGRNMHGAASFLLRRRRFNNEKEFVLHWVFIMVASATIAFFLAS